MTNIKSRYKGYVKGSAASVYSREECQNNNVTSNTKIITFNS